MHKINHFVYIVFFIDGKFLPITLDCILLKISVKQEQAEQLNDFSFIVSLVVGYAILFQINPVSKFVQTINIKILANTQKCWENVALSWNYVEIQNLRASFLLQMSWLKNLKFDLCLKLQQEFHVLNVKEWLVLRKNVPHLAHLGLSLVHCKVFDNKYIIVTESTLQCGLRKYCSLNLEVRKTDCRQLAAKLTNAAPLYYQTL